MISSEPSNEGCDSLDTLPKPLHLLDKQENEETPSYDRDWLKKLIQKHSSDPRLQKYNELHEKYPILADKALVVAPMVDQSDLPFRLLCRDYGTNLCFTPMIHAKMFTELPGYRKKFWSYVEGTPPSDRPLIVQLCGSDKENLLFTIKYIMESKNGVDGIDLNCGCPQSIAKRGMYGAFLLEKDDGDAIVDIVSYLVKEVGRQIPISVKVRLLPSGVEDSLKLYGRLIDAGAAMLTVHGRNRLQKMYQTGQADWDTIKRVVELYSHRVPILSNGSIGTLDDVRACLEHTGADGIMSSESILEYPPLFTETGTEAVGGKRVGPSRLTIARQYLEYHKKFPSDKAGQASGFKCIRAHFHKFLHADLQKYTDVRDAFLYGRDYETFEKACDDIQAYHEVEGHVCEDEEQTWYIRHRVAPDHLTPDEKQIELLKQKKMNGEEKKEVDPDEEAAMNCNNLFGGGDDDDDGEQCW